MNILQEILGAGNGQMVDALASQFGLDREQASNAVGNLLPAVSRGLQREMAGPGGMESLAGALERGNHGRYVDDPSVVGDQLAIQEGNDILGHIFGSKDVSREVARRASTASGLDAGILKQMLPIIAGMAMGALNKSGAAADLKTGAGESGAMPGGLSTFLDMDGDGSVADDLFDIARRFL